MPAINGVTTESRAARAADERELSDRTASLMPALGDLGKMLGVKGGGGQSQKSAASKAADDDDEEDETPEEDDEEQKPTEEQEEDTEDAPESEDADTEEEEAPEEEEEEEEPKEGDGKKKPDAGMQKRIDKLTAQKTTLQSELDAAKDELEQLRAADKPARQPSRRNEPMAGVLTTQQLDEKLAAAREFKQWAIRNPEGGTMKGPDGKDQEVSAEDRHDLLAKAEAIIEAGPERKQWLSTRSASEAELKAVFPTAFEKGHDHEKAIREAMLGMPREFIEHFPDARRLVAGMLIGLGVLDGQKKAGSSSDKGGKTGTAKTDVRAARQDDVTPKKKAPPAPAGRTAGKAPAADVRKKQSAQSNTDLAKGKRDALESRVLSFLG